jgi:Rap1a immunity proteins
VVASAIAPFPTTLAGREKIMMHFFHSAALGLALHITPVVGFNTGNDLWYNCREPSQEILCVSYIQGLIAGLTIYGDKTPLFCAPDQVALGQAEDIVLRYLAAHVERRQEEARWIVVWALRETFPCR